MDLPQEATFAVGGAIVALLLQWIVRYVMDRNPEVLTSGRLRAYGLPHKGPDAKRFKRIFTKSKAKRVRIAEDEKKRLEKEMQKSSNTIENHQSQYADNMIEVNANQEKIREADTKGQRQTDSQAYLVPVLHRTGLNLKTIGANTSIAVVLAKEYAFWEQIASGLNRVQVNDHLTDPEAITQKMETFMPEALKAARQTLSLSESEYEKTVEFWIEQF
jgi:DNA primase catalytic subunit